MLVLRLIALFAIALITAGVIILYGLGAGLIVCGSIIYVDLYLPAPGGGPQKKSGG